MPAPATRQRPPAHRPQNRARLARGPLWERLLRKVLRTVVLATRAHPHTTAIVFVGTVSAVLLQVTDTPAAADSTATGHRITVTQAAHSPARTQLDLVGMHALAPFLPSTIAAGIATGIDTPALGHTADPMLHALPAPALGLVTDGAAVAAPAASELVAVAAPDAAVLVSPAAAAIASATEPTPPPRKTNSTYSTLAGDPGLQSATALVMDLRTGTPLYAKNDLDVLPIASITKLMTALVVVESRAPLGEVIEITNDDIDRIKSSTSRLRVGAKLTRETLLRLALMASENRAASALSRAYPGGKPAFVAAMNRKAAALGMRNTHFDDPTGLSKTNVSTAHDLVRLVQEDWRNPLMRAFTTSSSLDAQVGRQVLTFNNTNPLLRSPHTGWQISLSKTGYISEAGHCLVMRATVAARDVVIVLLNSQGRYTRIGDANRLRRWMESQPDARRQRLT